MLECPAYSYIRTQYLDIFRPAWNANTLATGMRAIFTTKQQMLLAECLHRMLRHRSTVLNGQISPDDPTLHSFAERALAPIPDPATDPY